MNKAFVFFVMFATVLIVDIVSIRAIDKEEANFCIKMQKLASQPHFFITKNDKKMCSHHGISINAELIDFGK